MNNKKSHEPSKFTDHYAKISQAIEYFSRNQLLQPGLAELSRHVGLSEFHLQRVFSQWVGVSPKQYLQYLTKQYAKQCLRNDSVLGAALESGLSGAGRLHDLMIRCEGVTPGEYKRWGKGLRIVYGIHGSPFGMCLLASTDRGVCKLAFFDDEAQQQALIDELFMEWGEAQILWDNEATECVFNAIFAGCYTPQPSQEGSNTVPKLTPLNVLLKGSPFQLKVWEALLVIPEGGLCSYQQIADYTEQPTAARAVASAIAKNNIGYLIPCHRVIRGNGDFSQYRWGGVRKQSLIAWEASTTASLSSEAAD